MKFKGVYLMVALALGGVGAAQAQDSAATTGNDAASSAVDGRWYIAPTVGGYFNDSDRHTNGSQFYYGLGVGKFFTKDLSLDVFVDSTKRSVKGGAGSWTSNNLGVAARWYFTDWTVRPYLLSAVMGSHHNDPSDRGWAPAAELGLGISSAVTDSTDVRLEGGYRYDWDNQSVVNKSGFGDWFLGLSIVSRFGAAPAAPAPAPAPVAPAATTAPAPVQEAPAPQPVVIDLRGVNFKYDRPKAGEKDIAKVLAEPTADSISLLEQAVDTLKRYPDVHVTVAGYTDGKGKPAYNQALSERRAQIVYSYLTSHGIDASRLTGPVGHGANDPIGDNATDAGRAQNRRVELQVQH